jgi:ribonucleoside-diphosphate reductase subunit M1
MRQQIIAHNGSIQAIASIPSDLKQLHKTVWEMKQRTLIDMAADRGAFIDQSQSLNVYISEPTLDKLTSLHMYTWRKGLKTGMYYLRQPPAADAKQLSIDKDVVQAATQTGQATIVEACSRTNPNCESCSG